MHVTPPETQYARSGDLSIAYQAVGEGPRDILFIPGFVSNVEIMWELPFYRHIFERFLRLGRLIVFDKRGQGLSDRVAEQTLEERTGDVRAVMDAAGSECATIYGWSEGGPMCLMFAATYPERTSALVLYGTFASMRNEPWGVSREQLDQFLGVLDNRFHRELLRGRWPDAAAFDCDNDLHLDELASRLLERFRRNRDVEAFALLMETVAALQREGKDVIQGSLVKDTIKRKQPQFNEEYHGYNSFGRLLEDAQRHGLIKLRKDGRSGTWVIDEVLEDGG